ncbi:MAG: hypothetical protein HUU57_17050 [Bdellovibrio sp.]|nr:hypothetical protein [Bdellovibrio sp.]
MKFLSAITSIFLIVLTQVTSAATNSSLYIQNGESLIDVQTLIDNEETVFEDNSFCYRGRPESVVKKMKAWYKTDYFFSGTGGGFEMVKLTILRGIVTYDIVLTLEDEVVPGEYRSILIKPCQ